MKKIEAIIKPFKLDPVKEALSDAGVTGERACVLTSLYVNGVTEVSSSVKQVVYLQLDSALGEYDVERSSARSTFGRPRSRQRRRSCSATSLLQDRSAGPGDEIVSFVAESDIVVLTERGSLCGTGRGA
jgi:hypothetical protein